MALTFRAPVEEVIARFTSEEQSAISAVAVKSVKEREADAHNFFNYALSSLAKERLIKSGVYLSPYSYVPHSHPVCKTLENFFLYNVLPSHVDNSFFFVGIKNFKLSFLKIRNKNLSTIQSINRYVTSLDKSRYNSDFVCANSKADCSLLRHQGLYNSRTLSSLLPEVVRLKARKLFLHDELHYWSCNDLIYFLEECKPETLLATVVIPPEVLVNCSESLNPWAYKFKIEGSNLVFAPDGCWVESYTQPIASRFILKAKRLYLGDGSYYNVDLVSSKFCHHLIAITKGDLLNQNDRHFGGFDAIGLKGLSSYCSSMSSCYPIRLDIITKVYLYLRTLKKPDLQSAEAKLRQLIDEPNGREIKFIEDFSKLVISCGQVATVLNRSLIKTFVFNMMPHMIGCFTEFFNARSIENFIFALESFNFSIRTRHYDRNFIDEIMFESIHPELTDFDLPGDLDKKFTGVDITFHDRNPQGYSSHPIKRGCCWMKPHDMLDGVKLCDIEMVALYYLRRHSHIDNEGLVMMISRAIHAKKRRINIRDVIGDVDKLRQFVKKLDWKIKMNLTAERLNTFKPRKIRWFTNAQRVNQLYLEFDHFEKAQTLKGVNEMYATIVNEIRGFGSTSKNFLGPKEKSQDGGNEDSVFENGQRKGMQTEGGTNEKVCMGVDMKILSKLQSTTSELANVEEVNSCEFEAQAQSSKLITLPKEVDLGTEKRQLAKLQELNLCALTGTNWESIVSDLSNLLSKDFQFIKADLCGCFQSHHYLKNKANFEKLNTGLRSIRASIFDVLVIANHQSIHRANELIRGNHGYCAAIGLRGVTEYHSIYPEKGIMDIKKVEPSIFVANCFGIYNLSLNGSVAILIQTDRVRVGNWTAHSEDCFFSGSTQLLYGCPIRISRENKAEDFNVFDVPGDGNCLWHSIGHLTGMDGLIVKEGLLERMHAANLDRDAEDLNGQFKENAYAEREALAIYCLLMQKKFIVITPDYEVSWVFGEDDWTFAGFLILMDSHYQPAVPSNGCVVRALAAALERSEVDILAHLCKNPNRFIFEDICRGKGLNIAHLEDTFRIFDINAICDFPGFVEEFNHEGANHACFTVQNGHMEFTGRKSIKKAAPKISALRTVTKSSLMMLKQNGTVINFKPDLKRANKLQDCLLSGLTGAISSELFGGRQRMALEGRFENVEREVVIILGTFGSGKSWLYKEFIRKSPGKNIIFVSPRRSLADAIRDDLGLYDEKRAKKLTGVEIVTFEVFLLKVADLKRGHTVILDEIQLFPPGYLDLSSTLANEGVNFVLAGDPCQAHYDSAKDRMEFKDFKVDIMHILQDKQYRYNILSRRFKNRMFEGRLPCSMADCGSDIIDKNYVLISSLKEMVREYPLGVEVILVGAFDEKKIIEAYFGSKQKVLTFGESTGMNFEMGCILITGDTKYVDDRRWLTALSRFSKWFIIANVTGTTHDNLLSMYFNKPLHKFLTGTSCEDDMRAMLPGEPEFAKGFDVNIGKDEGIVEEKVAGDPWLKSELFLGQREDVEDECYPIEETPAENWFRCHLPLSEMEPVRARWAAKLALKEAREFRVGTEVTEQFTDEHERVGEVLTNACERYEAIYPRHKGTDSITFLMAVRKRLKFSRPDVESSKLRKARPYGQYLLKEFLKRVPLSERHDAQAFEQSCREFEEKKTSKSGATIENHSGRSCRDWLSDVALIFMKSQHCTKFDNRFRDAKAGQTLACFHHSVLCRFAPFMRYIEKKVAAALPKNFYIHSGKNIDELNDWVIQHNFSGECTESDYEAFDSSQDHYILSFELSLMQFLGLPGDLIEDYIFIKTHLGSKLGNFSIMRFTGEASTFLFNTLANMLFTFLRYDLNGSESLAFAGDDMCANMRLKVSKKHESFLNKLSLKAKVCFTKNPTFCGWCLTPSGVFKKPQLVWERICIAREKNNIVNCIDNYAIEVSYAYKLGEAALQYMTEEEVDNHYLCVRYIIRNKHVMKCNVACLFSS